MTFLDQHVKDLGAPHNELVQMGARCKSRAEDSDEEDKAKAAALRRVFGEPNFTH